MNALDPGAVRAARALRNGHLQAVEDRDLGALIENVAGWMGVDLDTRAAVLAEERSALPSPDTKEQT